MHRRQLQYLVLWKGYPLSEATWEPDTHFHNAPEALRDFHQRYPLKPGANLGGRPWGEDNVIDVISSCLI